ncbi:hypothetical protein OF83DRAFT_1148395, partial [Amylostereum chailletii]
EPFQKEDALDTMVSSFRGSLKLRLTLPLVSRELNVLGTPILYECIHLSPTTPAADALATFKSSTFKRAMVRHVILDVSPRQSESEADLAALVALLSRVRILTGIVMHTQRSWVQSPCFYRGLLVTAMSTALVPTLRRVVFHRNALTLFPAVSWSQFTEKLAHLEAFAAFGRESAVRDGYAFDPAHLPDALPTLTHLQLDQTPLLVGKGYKPKSPRCSAAASLSSTPMANRCTIRGSI